MEIAEALQLSAMLGQGAQPETDGKLCVDTFRTPYCRWSEPFEWPSVSLLHSEPAAAAQLIERLNGRMAAFFRGMNILPEARPRRDEPNLHLVRVLSYEGSHYLFKLRILMTYMGGAESSQMEHSVQDRSPAFRTDRIYFQARIFPVNSVERREGIIVDFEPEHYDPASGIRSGGLEAHHTARWNVVLFDEMDFSDLEKELRERVTDAKWQPGRLFNPFVIDHGTVNWNLFHVPDAEAILPYFHRLWHHLKSGRELDHEDRRFWEDYYTGWKYRRFLSAGGNPHWEIEQAPGW